MVPGVQSPIMSGDQTSGVTASRRQILAEAGGFGVLVATGSTTVAARSPPTEESRIIDSQPAQTGPHSDCVIEASPSVKGVPLDIVIDRCGDDSPSVNVDSSVGSWGVQLTAENPRAKATVPPWGVGTHIDYDFHWKRSEDELEIMIAVCFDALLGEECGKYEESFAV